MASFLTSYERLHSKKITVAPLLSIELESILGKISRCLTVKQKVNDPLKVTFDHQIHSDIFLQWYRAIRDNTTHFGVDFLIKQDRKEKIKTVTLTFTDIRSFKFHVTKACGENIQIDSYITKKKDHNKLELLTPIKKTLDSPKHSLKFKASYQAKNQYNNIIS